MGEAHFQTVKMEAEEAGQGPTTIDHTFPIMQLKVSFACLLPAW